jgi:hypothetical protein
MESSPFNSTDAKTEDNNRPTKKPAVVAAPVRFPATIRSESVASDPAERTVHAPLKGVIFERSPVFESPTTTEVPPEQVEPEPTPEPRAWARTPLVRAEAPVINPAPVETPEPKPLPAPKQTFEDMLRSAHMDDVVDQPAMQPPLEIAPTTPDKSPLPSEAFHPDEYTKLSSQEAQERIDTLQHQAATLGSEGSVAVLGMEEVTAPHERPTPQPAKSAAPRLQPTPNQQTESSYNEADGIKLEEGQRVVHSEWLTTVVNNKGEVVTDAINYGRGLQQEQHQEQLQDRTTDTQQQADDAVTVAQDNNPTAAVPPSPLPNPLAPTTVPAPKPAAPSTYQDRPMYQGLYALPNLEEPALPSGLTRPELQAGESTQVDPQHLLPTAPKSPLKETLTSPWVWAMIVLLLVAFFAASFIG